MPINNKMSAKGAKGHTGKSACVDLLTRWKNTGLLLMCLKIFSGTGWTTLWTNGLKYTSACVIQYQFFQYTTYAQSKVVNIDLIDV